LSVSSASRTSSSFGEFFTPMRTSTSSSCVGRPSPWGAVPPATHTVDLLGPERVVVGGPPPRHPAGDHPPQRPAVVEGEADVADDDQPGGDGRPVVDEGGPRGV